MAESTIDTLARLYAGQIFRRSPQNVTSAPQNAPGLGIDAYNTNPYGRLEVPPLFTIPAGIPPQTEYGGGTLEKLLSMPIPTPEPGPYEMQLGLYPGAKLAQGIAAVMGAEPTIEEQKEILSRSAILEKAKDVGETLSTVARAQELRMLRKFDPQEQITTPEGETIDLGELVKGNLPPGGSVRIALRQVMSKVQTGLPLDEDEQKILAALLEAQKPEGMSVYMSPAGPILLPDDPQEYFGYSRAQLKYLQGLLKEIPVTAISTGTVGMSTRAPLAAKALPANVEENARQTLAGVTEVFPIIQAVSTSQDPSRMVGWFDQWWSKMKAWLFSAGKKHPEAMPAQEDISKFDLLIEEARSNPEKFVEIIQFAKTRLMGNIVRMARLYPLSNVDLKLVEDLQGIQTGKLRDPKYVAGFLGRSITSATQDTARMIGNQMQGEQTRGAAIRVADDYSRSILEQAKRAEEFDPVLARDLVEKWYGTLRRYGYRNMELERYLEDLRSRKKKGEGDKATQPPVRKSGEKKSPDEILKELEGEE